jgi:hypothetical protein
VDLLGEKTCGIEFYRGVE